MGVVGRARGGRRPLTSLYEMICYVFFMCVCDIARVCRVHPLLMASTHFVLGPHP